MILERFLIKSSLKIVKIGPPQAKPTNFCKFCLKFEELFEKPRDRESRKPILTLPKVETETESEKTRDNLGFRDRDYRATLLSTTYLLPLPTLVHLYMFIIGGRKLFGLLPTQFL